MAAARAGGAAPLRGGARCREPTSVSAPKLRINERRGVDRGGAPRSAGPDPAPAAFRFLTSRKENTGGQRGRAGSPRTLHPPPPRPSARVPFASPAARRAARAPARTGGGRAVTRTEPRARAARRGPGGRERPPALGGAAAAARRRRRIVRRRVRLPRAAPWAAPRPPPGDGGDRNFPLRGPGRERSGKWGKPENFPCARARSAGLCRFPPERCLRLLLSVPSR